MEFSKNCQSIPRPISFLNSRPVCFRHEIVAELQIVSFFRNIRGIFHASNRREIFRNAELFRGVSISTEYVYVAD